MGDINTGNQIIRWEYNQNISTQEINQMWGDNDPWKTYYADAEL